jgi:hypothetical protein
MRPTIATAAGVEFSPFNPNSDDILLSDIALALANKCRFTGHTKWHYSVAQHSVYAYWMAKTRGHSEEIQKWALLHDATEAYFPDVASPLKPMLYVRVNEDSLIGTDMIPFKVVENRLAACIMKRFGLPPVEPHEVKVIDAELYRMECATLMPPITWKKTPQPSHDAPLIEGWTSNYARSAWYYIAIEIL